MARKKSEVVVSLKDKVTARLKKIEKGFGKLVGTLTKVGSVAVGVGAFFTGKFLVGAIKSSAEFQSQMSTVGAVTRATGEELNLLEAAADAAGTKTRFTATQAAQGLEELGRAGLTAGEAITTLNPTLQLAQANSIEVADAATLVTTTLNQFGKGAEYAATATDILTRGTQTSAQNIEQLSNALEFAGPQARQMGLDLEQTTAIIGKLADQGFRGEKGGTAFRNALIELQSPSSNFRKELAGLNINSTDFVEVLEQLAAKGDLSQEALLSLGKRAGPAISALVAGGVDDLGNLIQTLREAGGTAEETAKKMDDNLGGAFLGFMSAFDAVRRTLVDPLLKPIQGEIESLTAKLREFATSDALSGVGKKLQEVFGSAVEAVASFIREVNFDRVVENIKGFLGTTAEVFRTFVENSKAAATSAALVWDGFGLVFDGIKAATAGAAAGVIELTKHFAESELASKKSAQATREWLGLDTSSLDAQIKDLTIRIGGLGAAQERMFEIVDNGITGAKENWAQLTGKVDENVAAIKNTAPAFDKAADSADAAGDSMRDLAYELEKVADAGEDAGRDAADGVKAVGEGAKDAADDIQTLQGKVSELGQNIREELLKDAETARKAFETTLDSQSATLEQKRAAFMAYAEAAIAANNGVISSEIAQQAAILGTTNQLEGLRQKVEEVKRAQAGAAAELRKGVEDLSQPAEEQKRKFGELSEKWQEGAKALGGFIAGIISSWTSLNEKAGTLLTTRFDALARGIHTTMSYLHSLAVETKSLARIQDEQNASLKSLNDGYEKTGDTVQFVARATNLLRTNLLLLDQTTIDQLQARIDRAKASMDAFRESAVNALHDAQRELLQLQGNELEVLRQDAAGTIAELEAQLANAPDGASRRALQDAIRLQKQILKIKEDQLATSEAQAAANAAQQAAESRAASQQQSSSPSSSSSAVPVPASAIVVADPFAGSSRSVTITLVAPDGLTADLLAQNEDIAQRVIEILAQMGQVDSRGIN